MLRWFQLVSLHNLACFPQSTWHFMFTLNEACRENVMTLRDENDRNVDSVRAVAHRKILRLRSSVDAVRARTQPPPVTDPPESDSVSAEPRGFSSFTS